jgi:hypothetical protein
LVIFQVSGTDLKPLRKTAVRGLTAVSGYEWVSNNLLLLSVETGGGDPAVWTSVNIDKGVMVPMRHQFAHVIKTHWGDADHALISDLCGLELMCLYSWNVLINNGLPYAKPLSIAQSPRFSVEDGDKLIAMTSGPDAAANRLTWDEAAHNWVPAPAPAPGGTDARAGQAAGDRDGFQQAQTRYAALVADSHIQAAQVTTSGSHRVVGIAVPPPGPAFMALHHDLENPSSQVAAAFPGKRVYWTSVSDDLNHALLTVQGIGEPVSYFLWSRETGTVLVARSHPTLDETRLAPTRVEDNWFEDGTPVSITTPPNGVAPVGLLLQPIVTNASRARQLLTEFNGNDQVLAQHGVTILRVPVNAPDAGTQGSLWRKRVATRLASAADQAIMARLAAPGKICIGGSFDAGYAALAAAAQSPEKYARVIAVDIPFRPAEFSHPLELRQMTMTATPRATVRRVWTFGVAEQRRWNTMTAQDSDGALGSGNPADWASQLPARVFLAYRMTSDSFGGALELQADAFQEAMKKAGKPIGIYAPDKNFGDDAKWLAAMDEAILDYLR